MSGSSEQSQRYAEQLVLYTKANNILVATLKDVELEVARSSQEPPENLTKGVCVVCVCVHSISRNIFGYLGKQVSNCCLMGVVQMGLVPRNPSNVSIGWHGHFDCSCFVHARMHVCVCIP